VHHLHNLIWVDCSGMNPDWYPGDAYVDVVGIDQYPSDVGDPLSSTWETLLRQYDGRKLLALTEFGGVPDVEKMRRFGVRWAYFVSWSGDLGAKKMAKGTLTRIYQSGAVVNSKENPGH
ncbi:MAG: mannan endo-1,4-beta-mannosidase, partial [Armatimonadetes bacterium]|nr:mannan endo-1,4-beta-mannosidase [Armatimonadota bacterium]